MHYSAVGHGRSWPDAPIGLVRLWDTGTTWRDVQPARDRWDFSALDRAVANARAHHAQIALVLGQTPAWASSRPMDLGDCNGPGVAAPPVSVEDWWIYAHAVATRYRGRIAAYEIWNEVNLPGYFSGSIAQMVRLTRIGRDAVKRRRSGRRMWSRPRTSLPSASASARSGPTRAATAGLKAPSEGRFVIRYAASSYVDASCRAGPACSASKASAAPAGDVVGTVELLSVTAGVEP
jgi:hypothetical protein